MIDCDVMNLAPQFIGLKIICLLETATGAPYHGLCSSALEEDRDFHFPYLASRYSHNRHDVG